MSLIELPAAWHRGSGVVWGVSDSANPKQQQGVIYFRSRRALTRQAGAEPLPGWMWTTVMLAVRNAPLWAELELAAPGMIILDRERGILEVWRRHRGSWDSLVRKLLAAA
jgi:hypothetical protein